MHVHLVFVTKYRREVFTKEILDDLSGIFSAVCTDFEAELVEFDGEDDHVHLLVNYPPKVAVSVLVNSLKGVSSRTIRKKHYPPSAENYGAARYGRPPISREAAAVRPSKSSASTSNNSRRRISARRTPTASALSFPALKGEVCRVPDQMRGFTQPDRHVEDAVIEAVQANPEQFLQAYVADKRWRTITRLRQRRPGFCPVLFHHEDTKNCLTYDKYNHIIPIS
jgi:REP element-mobilizing transposase RayT